jgi:hypothetical protein
LPKANFSEALLVSSVNMLFKKYNREYVDYNSELLQGSKSKNKMIIHKNKLVGF